MLHWSYMNYLERKMRRPNQKYEMKCIPRTWFSISKQRQTNFLQFSGLGERKSDEITNLCNAPISFYQHFIIWGCSLLSYFYTFDVINICILLSLVSSNDKDLNISIYYKFYIYNLILNSWLRLFYRVLKVPILEEHSYIFLHILL